MDYPKEFIPIELFTETFKIKKWLARIIMQLMKINKLNRFYKKQLIPFPNYVEMYRKSFKQLNITVNFDNSFLDKLENGSFFAIANHSFGFLDAGIFIVYIGERYPQLKITTNFLLSKIETAKDFIIPVNPFEGKDGMKKGMGAFKKAMATIEQGNPVGLFPAGEVATFDFEKKGARNRIVRPKRIVEKDWPSSSFRLIRSAQAPVVPIYFEGTNSRMFHFLGRITPYWRTFRLIKEFFLKKNAVVNVYTGDIVNPETYNQFKTDEELRDFFRSEVFKLKK
ncbi:MAG: hypothetical protein ACTSRE_14500 [Promethearchaeota archaeon]